MQTTRATPPLLKNLNERTVLETIRLAAPISRAQISRRAGISKPTVSLALESLLAAGLVREAAHDPAGPSYGAVFFEPVPEAALVLGLDLGARFLRGALCDLNGTVRARQDVEVAGFGAEELVDAIASLRSSLTAASDLPEELIDNAVIGVPGVVETGTGRVTLATNVPGIEGDDFRLDVAAQLSHHVTLENDINLAAIGEHSAGIARGVDDFVFLSIGTGLGSGSSYAARSIAATTAQPASWITHAPGTMTSTRARARCQSWPSGSRASGPGRRRWRLRTTRPRSSPPPGAATRLRPRSSRRKRGASHCTSLLSQPWRTLRWWSSAAASARTATSCSSPCARCSQSRSSTRRASRCPA